MKTAKQLIEEIDDFFAQEERDRGVYNQALVSEKRKLWAILTALRGPDVEDPDSIVKFNTTARIRQRVLPKTVKAESECKVVFPAFLYPGGNENEAADMAINVSLHFYSHYIQAVSVLDKMGK